MGHALYSASPAARSVFERADDALGCRISRLCFEGPEAELTLTANAQPAILTTSMAALAALREAFPDLEPPVCAAGHSLGEYSALVAAGALAFEDAVQLVRLRGRAMQEAVPAGEGAMAAVMGGDPHAVDTLCQDARAAGEVLTPANFNAPGQVVIAGSRTAVERAAQLAGDRKLKLIPLKVSAPFHCSLMAPAARAVEKALKEVPVAELAFDVVSNVDAKPNREASKVADRLVRQIDGAVLWEPSVHTIVAQGVTHALEIGPGRVLAGLVRKIDKNLPVQSVGEPEHLAEVRKFLAPKKED